MPQRAFSDFRPSSLQVVQLIGGGVGTATDVVAAPADPLLPDAAEAGTAVTAPAINKLSPAAPAKIFRDRTQFPSEIRRDQPWHAV
jgi:hypothetical protein